MGKAAHFGSHRSSAMLSLFTHAIYVPFGCTYRNVPQMAEWCVSTSKWHWILVPKSSSMRCI